MHATGAVALFAVLACAQAFMPAAPLASKQCSSRSATSLQMALKPEDFVPSEEWMMQYLGQDGIRYNMGKTPDEIKTEGK